MQEFADYIGRSADAGEDQITSRLLTGYDVTLGGARSQIGAVPPALHWCLCPEQPPASALGPEGHAERGAFLPPVELPVRMWAGGEVNYHGGFEPGDHVRKTSQIADIAHKTGKTGPLCFVSVDHEYHTARGLALSERQDIVYRAPTKTPVTTLKPSDDPNAFDHQTQLYVDEITLFRYSALTFNSHRIHFDWQYTTGAEHYPDLVIHGPLQASLMLNLAATARGRHPKRFTYRGRSAATGAQMLRIGACETENGLDLVVLAESGVTTMVGTAQW